MNKQELLVAVAEQAGVTKADADKVLSALISTLQSEVNEGNKVSIPSFGIFELGIRKERIGRNPSTGESMTFPEKRVPKFKFAKAFKDSVE